jgi:hypothetical protein
MSPHNSDKELEVTDTKHPETGPPSSSVSADNTVTAAFEFPCLIAQMSLDTHGSRGQICYVMLKH